MLHGIESEFAPHLHRYRWCALYASRDETLLSGKQVRFAKKKKVEAIRFSDYSATENSLHKTFKYKVFIQITVTRTSIFLKRYFGLFLF